MSWNYTDSLKKKNQCLFFFCYFFLLQDVFSLIFLFVVCFLVIGLFSETQSTKDLEAFPCENIVY